MTACALCSCPGRHPKPRVIAAACADPARCWQWDHSCWAKRMRAGHRTAAVTPIGPAMLRGAVVPNLALAVAA